MAAQLSNSPRLRRLPKDRQLGPELLYRTCQCDRDRTYGSAVALKNWIDQHQVNVTGFNIITENVHARRSRPLFQWAFGNRVRLGVIAVQNPDYDPAHWWRYSQGLKDIVSEGCAYLYAKFFFPHMRKSQ
jgi:hypothetical protein